MGTNTPDISSLSTCDSILKHIINCANAALQNEDAFQKAMLELASELRKVFDSDFCSIGIVTDGCAEDCIRSYKEFEDEELSEQQKIFLKSFKRASLDEDTYIVCKALKLNKNIFFPQEEINQFNNNKYYPSILTSGHLIDSYVFPLQDKEKKIFGYIQFINSKKDIDYQRAIFPYSDALLGLVQIIINNQKKQQELEKKQQELEKQNNRIRDFDFYNEVQDNKNNVEKLLDKIMEYFSKEFNAAVISFRIPLLNCSNKELLFYLRRVFVHESFDKANLNELIEQYHKERFVKDKGNMKVAEELRCDIQGHIESISDTDFSQFNLDLDDKTLVMPIFRDIDQECTNPLQNKDQYCEKKCNERFKRLYGIFRLRISKKKLSNNNELFFLDYEETKVRLAYLSKQITLLFNSIVDKHENESLKIFQNELRKSSFIKIKDFDKSCVDIIKKSVHAIICSIYRFNDRTKRLYLSATTAKKIHFVKMNEELDTSNIIKSCYIHINSKKNVLTQVFNSSVPKAKYVLNMLDTSVHESPFIEVTGKEQKVNNQSAMVVPMIKKDGSLAGIVLLLGKEELKHSISTTYWEHDITHISFIVNILTRISESDTERLTFLSQLSHELLAPVNELVTNNELTVKSAEKKPDSFTKRQLISKLREDIDRNMLFKYIVSDTEFIYSSTDQLVDYNIVKQDKPQQVLLDAIRLLEKEAEYKGVKIKTYISKMPPLFFDKERMMQVFLNLLKNAIRYSRSNTEITISYNQTGNNFHELCFSNYGIGINEQERESIFDLFYRGQEAKNKFIRGTGIGLYIIRNIMKAHGGNCFVSKLNNPTEFVITLKDNHNNN